MSIVGESSLGRPVVVQAADSSARLVVGRCEQCGDLRFPARSLCPVDQGPMIEDLSPTAGMVYEAVMMSMAPAGFDAPLWVGYVDMGASLRVYARFDWPDDGIGPAHGDPVDLTWGVVRTDDGEPVWGPVFTPGAAR